MVAQALHQRTQTGCYTSLFTDIAPMRFDANLEKIAEQHLYDPDADVISDAAQALGKYGSPAAEAALWARLRKPDDNAKRRADYESRLAGALGTGQNWYIGQTQLHKIRSLCTSYNGLQQVDEYLRITGPPSIHIDYEFLSDQGYWTIGQYNSKGSAAFFAKLAQFPRGTKFSWQDISVGPGEERLFKKATAVAKAHGMSIKRWHPEVKK